MSEPISYSSSRQEEKEMENKKKKRIHIHIQTKSIAKHENWQYAEFAGQVKVNKYKNKEDKSPKRLKIHRSDVFCIGKKSKLVIFRKILFDTWYGIFFILETNHIGVYTGII